MSTSAIRVRREIRKIQRVRKGCKICNVLYKRKHVGCRRKNECKWCNPTFFHQTFTNIDNNLHSIGINLPPTRIAELVVTMVCDANSLIKLRDAITWFKEGVFPYSHHERAESNAKIRASRAKQEEERLRKEEYDRDVAETYASDMEFILEQETLKVIQNVEKIFPVTEEDKVNIKAKVKANMEEDRNWGFAQRRWINLYSYLTDFKLGEDGGRKRSEEENFQKFDHNFNEYKFNGGEDFDDDKEIIQCVVSLVADYANEKNPFVIKDLIKWYEEKCGEILTQSDIDKIEAANIYDGELSDLSD